MCGKRYQTEWESDLIQCEVNCRLLIKSNEQSPGSNPWRQLDWAMELAQPFPIFSSKRPFQNASVTGLFPSFVYATMRSLSCLDSASFLVPRSSFDTAAKRRFTSDFRRTLLCKWALAAAGRWRLRMTGVTCVTVASPLHVRYTLHNQLLWVRRSAYRVIAFDTDGTPCVGFSMR